MGMLGKVRSNREHKWVSANLSTYLDNRLQARGRERVEHHLGVCRSCREDLATLRQTVDLLRHMPRLAVPRSFILPQSAAEEQARHRRWDTAFGALRTATVVVSACLVLLVSSDALLSLGVPSLTMPRAQESTDEAPAVFASEASSNAAQSESAIAEVPAGGVAPAPEALALPESSASVATTGEDADAVRSVSAAPSEPDLAAAPVGAEGAPTGVEPTLGAVVSAPLVGVVPPTSIVPGAPAGMGGTAPAGYGVGGDATGDMGGIEPSAPARSPLAEERAGEVSPDATAEVADASVALESNEPSKSAVPKPAATAELLPTPGPEPTSASLVAAVPARQEGGSETLVAPRAVTDRPGKGSADDARRVFGLQAAQVWSVWQVIRIAAGVMLGLLMILLGGLVWVGYKRGT